MALHDWSPFRRWPRQRSEEVTCRRLAAKVTAFAANNFNGKSMLGFPLVYLKDENLISRHLPLRLWLRHDILIPVLLVVLSQSVG